MHPRTSSAARWVSFLLAILVALPLALASPVAHAQVTDADRNAARDLYIEGVSLQKQGRYADAVDRFQRSFAVFPAPTTALRIAQCKSALGQHVEAAEELRAIGNAALPANPSEDFIKAKQEAATELQSLEPRIPKLKINVQPSPLAGLSVTIDGVQMPVALIGVARPVNPGSHRIVAVAPGYSQAQAQVDVRERQQPIPEITLALQGGGVSYTTAPVNTGTPPNTYQGGYQPPQNGGYQNPGYGGAYNPYGVWVPPPRRPRGPTNAFMIGLDADIVVPVGTMGCASCNGAPNNATDINNALGVGGGVGLDVGFRLGRILYLGALLQPSFYNGAGGNGSSFVAGGVLGFMSNPEGVGAYFEIGGAYRTFSFSTATIANGPTSATGGEVILGVGIQVKAGWFRFIPKAEAFVGSTNDNSGVSGNVHAFFNFALAAFWERPLDTPVAASATVQAY